VRSRPKFGEAAASAWPRVPLRAEAADDAADPHGRAVRQVARARDLLEYMPALRRRRNAWLLDSALPSSRLCRFSFAGADPYLVVTARDGELVLDVRRAVRPDLPVGRHTRRGDPLELLRGLLPPAPAELDPRVAELPFVGGAVGCLGYELARASEPIQFAAREGSALPDLALLFVDRLLAVEHRSGRMLALGLGFGADEAAARERAGRAVGELLEGLEAPGGPRVEAAGVRGTPALRPRGVAASEYMARVRQAKARIEAGDVYQVCLTQRLEAECSADPWALYTALRRISPAPFAAFLELDDAYPLSSSPERFLRLDSAGHAETRPMKGTRRRGHDPASDAKQRAELASSAKDRAENVMIVDLERNDLGRVCETGSVALQELCAVEDYATVFQLVSTVTGRLAAGRDVFDLVRAAFPPGSMTGAPKLAAMRILDRLEPDRRGFYAGALGYFDLRGGADLCVVIRTLLLRQGRAELHVGGGVVADSDPAAEYQESMDKAEALLAALAAADPESEPAEDSAMGGVG
jgi:para-aminobenzoate synthetase component 1